jgi:hypothetical protein
MRSNTLITVVLATMLAVTMLSSFVGAEPASGEAAPQNWEYHVAQTPELSGASRGKLPKHAKTIQDFLNKYARDGWEFSSVHGRMTIFRRPVSSN